MSVKQFLVDLVFRGNSAGAKAAAQDVQKAVAGVNAETQSGTKATDQNTTATTKNADAKRRAAEEAKRLAEAEKRARDEALRAGAGVGGASTPSPTSNLPQAEKDRIKAIYNPTFAAQRQYESQLADIKSAEKTGALTSDEVAMAQARVRGSYEASLESIKRTDAALTGMNRNVKLQAYEQRMLSYQVSDTFQSFALGMPPMQILLQQGPQVIDIYGGIGNTMRALRQVITPLRVGMLGLGAVVVSGVSSWNAYLKSIKEVETAYDGLGRGLATSTSQLEAQARAGAAAAGISTKAARSMEAQFLRTAKIGADHYDEMIGMSKDFAATLGVEMDAIGGIMAEMFSDPAKGADTLYRKYGLIDAATMRLVQTKMAQNRADEAQAILLDALPDKLAKAEDGMHALDRAIQSIKRGTAGLWDGIGEGLDDLFDGPSLEQELSRARRHSRTVSRRGGDNAQEEATFTALRSAVGYEALNGYYETARAEAERQGKNALSIAEGSGATATSRQEQELRNQIAALEAGVGAPGLDQFQQDEITEALEAKSRVLDALINKQARLNELDGLDAQIAVERNPILRAELEERRARLQLADQEISTTELEAETARARQKIIEQTILTAQSQASDMQAEVEIRARLDAQVAAGLIKSEDVNRLLQEELTLRPLVAAAAAAEGEEKARLNGVIESMRKAYSDQAAADKTADRTSKLRDYLKTQQESAAQLRLELSLIGQSEAIRSRTLALFEVEKKIRELGLSGKAADQIREEAAQMVDLERQVDRVGEAWERVQSSGEDALDALLDGDFTGALDGLREQFMDLAINNPLKNALLGTDYGTLSDLGGLGGLWDRLTGKVSIDPASAARQAAQSVATMQVTAANVTISSMGAMGLGALGGAANVNGGLGAGSVQSQIASFFSGKGLSPTQIAGIMGNVSAESAFNPLAIGDGGTSFGLFQHHAGRGQGLLSSVGGMSGLGDVQGQLEYVWQELLTSENGVLKKLMASNTVEGATAAFAGFERPAGWTAADPTGAHNWTGRLAAAEQAMTQFNSATSMATQGLGTLGTGFDSFGQALAGAITGGGGGTDLLGSLFNIGLSALGLPGFAGGGPTGGSDPQKVAGLVHEGEYVFTADQTSRIGVKNLEAISKGTARGYATGGYVTAQSYPFLTGSQSGGNQSSAPIINVLPVNNSSVPLNMEVEETTNARGVKTQKMIFSDAVATGITTKGGKAQKALKTDFNVRRRGVSRL
ncbi:phage tail tip lysozyme [uncultured Celeribacter sp.]|uniref:phage tail tip lysozyme n=1 Tax=uncultured Celeribacter sp. TaxID=1303376 RepID=UPI002AA7B764|nr:phage tail tip lysozyme [uncultured Celeribacter sp.]